MRAKKCYFIHRLLPTKKNNQMKQMDQEVRVLLRSIIEKRFNTIDMEEATNSDLLGLLLESNKRYSQEGGSNKIPGMTTEDVIEECKLFYFGGHETSAVLLTWTVVVLSMHSTWQARAREEVLQVFGKNKPDFDGLNRLKIVSNSFIYIIPCTLLKTNDFNKSHLVICDR